MLKRLATRTSCALLLLFSLSSHASSTLVTELQKSSDASWTVEYNISQPIKKLVFYHSPDESRGQRWRSESGEFKISYQAPRDAQEGQERQESISRKDGKPFKRARFLLTPSYTHLPKSYAPFSPLSDGGMIINSGRFFACAQACDDEVNNWHLSLTVPNDEHMILNGEILLESASWSDRDSGKAIYVGKQLPVETAGTLSIIDQGLPQEIRQSLDDNIPKLMAYFEQKLGRLTSKEKPTLFASYSNRPGKDSQGGTLPGQIFMHWDFDDLAQKVNSDEFLTQTLFYLAHEVAHFFQSASSLANNAEAWVHEGSADLFAMTALAELYPSAKHYLDTKQADAIDYCIDGLKSQSLAAASDNGNFKMDYHCGMIIHRKIQQALAKQTTPPSQYDVWQQYRKLTNAGKAAGQDTFLNAVESNTSAALRVEIEAFIGTRHIDPNSAVEALLAN